MSGGEYYLLKRVLYERPDHKGYTGLRAYAGKWPLRYVNSYGEIDVIDNYNPARKYHHAIAADIAPEFTVACFPDAALNRLKYERGVLVAVLAEIRDQDETEIALDPDWPRRIARALIGDTQ